MSANPVRCVRCGTCFQNDEIGKADHATLLGHEPLAYHRSSRTQVKPSVRLKIFRRDKFTCRWCGWRDAKWTKPDRPVDRKEGNYLTIDHLRARALGGTNAQSNLITLCFDCNSRKGVAENERLQLILAHLRENDPAVIEAAFNKEVAS